MLSGLSQAAGMVLAPKSDGAIKHIEFASLGSGRALVILVAADGQVENRVIQIPPGLPPSALTEAANYLNARAAGRTLSDLRRRVSEEMAQDRGQLDILAAGVVEAGLATWTDVASRGGSLIVRGQGRLLADVTQIANLAAIQVLFDRLETQETMMRLLELAEQSDGVRIFIGAESALFGTSGVSMIGAPMSSWIIRRFPVRRRGRRSAACRCHRPAPRHMPRRAQLRCPVRRLPACRPAVLAHWIAHRSRPPHRR